MIGSATLAIAFLIVLIASAACTLIVRAIARRRAWLAMPREDRWHREPTALFGGVAIYVAFMAGSIAFVPPSRALTGLLILTTVMFLTGLLDDIRELKPQSKLVVQLTCGLLLYTFGYHFNDAIPWWIDLAVVVFWVVAITNAMNLLDNMNGLAAGIAVIAGVFRLLLYLRTGYDEGAIASSVFIGAVAGFLIFNFPRATVFMGDSGSFTIGFALAALNLTSSQAYTKSVFSVLLFPVLVLAIPIFDTAFVSMQRYFSGRAVSQGGRDHTSHRLVAVGLSESAAVLILWAISITAGLTAFVLYEVGFSYAWFVGALLILGLVLFGVVLGRVRVYAEDAPAADARPGFLLPAEWRYKRQSLWVLLDLLTIVLALYASALLISPTAAVDGSLFEAGRLAPVTVVAVLITLFARGLYRVDWQDIGVREVRTIVVGAAIGLGATWLLDAAVLQTHQLDPRLLVAAWGAIVIGLGGTRVFVRTLDEKIRGLSPAKRDGQMHG
jgi:UDP-GlcNAc:undecaprenyl-phosphate/decaprenyl-phosphate GlcNAc-1-phosphate transferase